MGFPRLRDHARRIAYGPLPKAQSVYPARACPNTAITRSSRRRRGRWSNEVVRYARDRRGAGDGSLPTPILSHIWSDAASLNPVLRARILEHEKRYPGTGADQLRRLAFGIWPARILRRCRRAFDRAWACHDRRGDAPSLCRPSRTTRFTHQLASERLGQRQPAGDFNQVHTHPGATWSGVYYVDHGDGESRP